MNSSSDSLQIAMRLRTIENIEQAFSNIPSPIDGINHWRELSLGVLQNLYVYRQILSQSPEMYRFYIPFYLIANLADEHYFKDILYYLAPTKRCTTLDDLQPPIEAKTSTLKTPFGYINIEISTHRYEFVDNPYFNELVEPFSLEQCRAIINYIKVFVHCNEQRLKYHKSDHDAARLIHFLWLSIIHQKSEHSL